MFFKETYFFYQKAQFIKVTEKGEFVYMDQKLAATLNFTAAQFKRDWHKVKLLIQNLRVPNDAETKTDKRQFFSPAILIINSSCRI